MTPVAADSPAHAGRAAHGPISLAGMTRPRLAALFPELPNWRADQVFRWIHARRATSFSVMTDLPHALRTDLAARFTLEPPRVVDRRQAADGTTRWVLELEDGVEVEAVYISEPERTTLCLSSQAGCRLACTFCATATLGLIRSLEGREMAGQALALMRAHGMPPGAPFNVVFMGMGEPMDNLDAVLEAFDVLTDAEGLALSWRRVTLSTAGHVPGIVALGRRAPRPRLAVSLNATTDLLRDRLMPINRRWPLAALRGALADFPVRSGERVTLEYVLLAAENDSDEDATRLAAFTRGLPVRVNLIPWNEVDGLPHRRPPDAAVERFRDRLLARRVNVSIRFSRGREVAAACGQLALEGTRPA